MTIDKSSFEKWIFFFVTGVERRIKILSRFLFVVEVWKLIFWFIFSLNKILIIQVKIDFVFFVTEGLFLVYFMLFLWIWNSFTGSYKVHHKIINLSISNAKGIVKKLSWNMKVHDARFQFCFKIIILLTKIFEMLFCDQFWRFRYWLGNNSLKTSERTNVSLFWWDYFWNKVGSKCYIPYIFLYSKKNLL